jgi:integrase/recombinase XerD
MITNVKSYLAVRHAVGFELKNTEYLLSSFARWAAQRGETHIHPESAIAWASQTVSLAQRDARLKTICRFARYLRAEDNRHQLPPANHFGYRKNRRVPHIYSAVEIRRLLNAASQLGPADSLQPHTFRTLIGLLAITGLRISEALALQFADVTPQGLLIHKTKFRKTRLVPLHETTAAVLQRYLTRRRERCGGEWLFIAEDGRPLRYWDVYSTFQKLAKAAKVSGSRGRRPRWHELRHTFAVRALEASPKGRQQVGQHLLALATYMGHVNIDATYWYLEATPELLRDIARAAETFIRGGQP